MKYIFILIMLFLLTVIFQIFTGIWIFYEKYSFSTDLIQKKILGDPENFINPASLEGLLETTVPHIVSLSVISFVIFHLFYFTKISCLKIYLFSAVFLTGIVNSICSILILKISPLFSYLKIFSFILFEICLVLSVLLLFYDIYVRSNKV